MNQMTIMKAGFLKGTILTVLILVMAFLIGGFFYSIGKKKVLSDDDRKSVSGKFIKLSQGVVHYEVTGPKTGQTVILIHGLATPYFIWDNNHDELVKAGFRVVGTLFCFQESKEPLSRQRNYRNMRKSLRYK